MKELEDAKQWYLDSVNATVDARPKAERDRDYVDLKQWTAEEEAELKRRKQPITVSPEIKENIETIIGLEIQNRTDIKAFPRNPGDEDAAEAATDALRYIADNTDFDQTKTSCAFNLLVEGTMAGIVEVKKTKKGFEVSPGHIPWDRFFIDQHASRKDGKDAKHMGQAIWLDKDEAIAMFPGVDESIITAGLEEAGGTDTYDDKPKNFFFDQKRQRVKLIEMYYNSGGWKHCIFTGLGYVIKPRPSPYLDEDGDPVNPIEIQRAFLDRDNNAYGFARQLISLVDELNKRRSKMLHLLSVRQIVADKGAVDNINKARREMNAPDGYVEKNPGKDFDVLPTGDLANGQMQLMLDAKQSLNSFGGSESLAGTEDRNMSGRALQIRQQSSVRGLSSVLDGLRHWEKRMYRQMWMRVKQFWTEEKWIRVTDDENNLKFVQINKPVTFEEVFQQSGQLYDALDPRINQTHHVENAVSELDVDIILDTVPDTTILQMETFEAFAQAVQASGTQVPLEMWLELMPAIPNKRQLKDTLKGGNLSPEEQQAQQAEQQAAQQAQQAQQSMAEEMHQLEMQGQMADIRAKMAKAYKDTVDAEAQDIENDAVQAGLMELGTFSG